MIILNLQLGRHCKIKKKNKWSLRIVTIYGNKSYLIVLHKSLYTEPTFLVRRWGQPCLHGGKSSDCPGLIELSRSKAVVSGTCVSSSRLGGAFPGQLALSCGSRLSSLSLRCSELWLAELRVAAVADIMAGHWVSGNRGCLDQSSHLDTL